MNTNVRHDRSTNFLELEVNVLRTIDILRDVSVSKIHKIVLLNLCVSRRDWNSIYRILSLNKLSLCYGSRKGTIQKYFANPKKIFQIAMFFQKSLSKSLSNLKKLLQILRKLLDPQITLLTIRKYFANP